MDRSESTADAMGGGVERPTAASELSDRWLDRGRQVAKHWKTWLTAAALALATWGLYGIGGWTLDTTTFAVATALLVGYRLVTLARDLRRI